MLIADYQVITDQRASRHLPTAGRGLVADYLPEPVALFTTTPMLAGLDGKKMSKTRGNGIPLHATAGQTAAMIRRAPTDTERRIVYDPITRPEVANLLDLLLAAVSGADQHQLADEIGHRGAGHLKQTLSEAINELLGPSEDAAPA